MIDLHCHVLPGIDDGALDVEDSVALALQASADGVTAICATPHIRHDHDVAVDEIADRVAALTRELDRRSIGCRILTGGEVAETAVAGLDDDELARVSLGGGGAWVLLEPAPGALSESLLDSVEQLERRGYGSLIAHPERHMAADFVERVGELVRRGALVQATAATFVDAPTREAMLELAARGLVHVLGSDAHSSRIGRPPTLSAAFAQLERVAHVREHIAWMRDEAPSAIVAGRPLAAPFAAS